MLSADVDEVFWFRLEFSTLDVAGAVVEEEVSPSSSALSPPLLNSLEFEFPFCLTALRLIFRDRGTGGVDGWVARMVRDPVRKDFGCRRLNHKQGH